MTWTNIYFQEHLPHITYHCSLSFGFSDFQIQSLLRIQVNYILQHRIMITKRSLYFWNLENADTLNWGFPVLTLILSYLDGRQTSGSTLQFTLLVSQNHRILLQVSPILTLFPFVILLSICLAYMLHTSLYQPT